ncbi:ATP-binding cassette domain-containing protein [Eudoraea adriatica]|uniref:ATP-binding cassette domain-containing protein n=1 Tax=Eudoraea adriatica TaxID=446681 RepID=UPI00037060B3|nr:ATP-binding cassette domain-containing protein [Eudoraea adriatica]
MTQTQHWAVFMDNQSNKQGLIRQLLTDGRPPQPLEALKGQKGALFSKLALDNFIEEEVRHDYKLLTASTSQSLLSMSSGERKKALLNYLLETKPDFIILDNPFDNLDQDSQKQLKKVLAKISGYITIIQLISRSADLLPFVTNFSRLDFSEFLVIKDVTNIEPQKRQVLNRDVPKALNHFNYSHQNLITFKNVSVSYEEKPILKNINWKIKKGEFWELAGKNGSGKTTLLSMVTGDNPKAYGQDIFLFGTRKGSGESVWDIKKNIGYFTPAMVDRFRGYHSLENMLISGLLDSIGLYIKPGEAQLRVAREWLALLNMEDKKDNYFHNLSLGQQRLIMCARAMIKHPLLLILDEPTAGLDDASAALVVDLVNKMAAESHTTIVFVSHRKEPELKAPFTYELVCTSEGSVGKVVEN